MRKEERKRKNERKMKDVCLAGENRRENVLICLKKLAALTVKHFFKIFLFATSSDFIIPIFMNAVS